MKAKVKKAALYTRVSSNGQNPKMQESELVEYVKRRGWVVHKVYPTRESPGQNRGDLHSILFSTIAAAEESMYWWYLSSIALLVP